MKLRLELTNNVTKTTINYDVIDYFSSNIFFHFELRLQDNLEKIGTEDIVDGEYTYRLYDGKCLVANGLCQIGDYVKENKEYSNEKKYKVYDGK